MAEVRSDQQGQETGVLVAVPAASNLICLMFPLSKCNFGGDPGNDPQAPAARQAAAEDRASSQRQEVEEPKRLRENRRFVGKWFRVNRKRNTFVLFRLKFTFLVDETQQNGS